MIESLDVILWDKKVGTLVANREGHRSKACFYFDSDYVRDGYDIAPLRAPVKGVAAQRGLPVYPDSAVKQIDFLINTYCYNPCRRS